MAEKCGTVLGMLPELHHGVLGPEDRMRVEAHLAHCADCASALEFVSLVERTRPEPPATLIGNIERALDAELSRPAVGRRRRAAPWTWSAAAALVLALGTGLVWQQLRVDPVGIVAEGMEPVPDSWLTDDAVVAGALVLDDLSDEDLSALLEEVGG